MRAFPLNFINIKCFWDGEYSQVFQTPLKCSEVESVLSWLGLSLMWEDDGVGAYLVFSYELHNRRSSR